jgi:REP element-mobilizing transposase RayT
MNLPAPKKSRRSPRAAWWHYGWSGAYFITICTAQRQPFFGAVAQGKMQLSPVGILADVLWHEVPHHAHHVELGPFVVMPNHVHGILWLAPEEEPEGTDLGAGHAVGSRHALTLPPPPPPSLVAQRYRNQGKNTVSSIVGSYKAAVTRHCRRLGLCEGFGWQRSFHDHIIRNLQAYDQIAQYIDANPENWSEDRFFV